MKTQFEIFTAFLIRYIQRSWKPEDGIHEELILMAEKTLGVKFDKSLRAFYLSIGNVKVLTTIHNQILSPGSAYIEDGYLIFMEENQGVVSWGIKLEDHDLADPIIWQRNNSENKWYSEDMELSKLLESMFNWYIEEDIIFKS